MNDTAGTYERDLTAAEIAERTELRDQLDDERDDLLSSVESRRREIRSFTLARKKIEARLLDVRRELRSGKVIESRQTSLPFPAGEAFGERYPMAQNAERLQIDLGVVLQGVLVPSVLELMHWHPSSIAFQEAAHWTRTELAHMNAKEHPELELPPRMPMPEVIAAIRRRLGRAVKEHTRKKAPRRAMKARPASETPIAKPSATKQAGAQRGRRR